jgi:hypothetical protein
MDESEPVAPGRGVSDVASENHPQLRPELAAKRALPKKACGAAREAALDPFSNPGPPGTKMMTEHKGIVYHLAGCSEAE